MDTLTGRRVRVGLGTVWLILLTGNAATLLIIDRSARDVAAVAASIGVVIVSLALATLKRFDLKPGREDHDAERTPLQRLEIYATTHFLLTTLAFAGAAALWILAPESDLRLGPEEQRTIGFTLLLVGSSLYDVIAALRHPDPTRHPEPICGP
jgi:hypothetical protein